MLPRKFPFSRLNNLFGELADSYEQFCVHQAAAGPDRPRRALLASSLAVSTRKVVVLLMNASVGLPCTAGACVTAITSTPAWHIATTRK